MSPTNIQKIHKDYSKRQIAFWSITILLTLVFLSVLISLYFPNIIKASYISSLLILLLFATMIILILTPPIIESYLLIRFHLNELIVSINKYEHNKAGKHLNNLVKNIDDFISEIEEQTVFTTARQTFHDFANLLKYQVYPKIEKNQLDEIDIDLLKMMSKSLCENEILHLKEIVDSNKNVSQIGNKIILLPYEKPNLLSRGLNYISGIVKKDSTIGLANNKWVKFALSFTILVIGISKIVTIDSTVIAAILTVSVLLARNE